MMEFRLCLSESEDLLPLQFNSSLSYIEVLADQLSGERQPIHPCLVFQIHSFGPLGPRLGVYLDGNHYSSIGVGDMGQDQQGGKVPNTQIGLTLLVDDSQATELQRLYKSTKTSPPYTWTTGLPKRTIEPFVRGTQVIAGRIANEIRDQLPRQMECSHCSSTHRNVELIKYVDSPYNPMFPPEAGTHYDGLESFKIVPRCPKDNREMDLSSS